LAADGSEHSIRASERAIELALIHNDSLIHIIYIIDEDDAMLAIK